MGIKRQIILCMEELDHTPDTSFERDVVCEEEEAFCLSTENIAMLNQLLNQVGGEIFQMMHIFILGSCHIFLLFKLDLV